MHTAVDELGADGVRVVTVDGRKLRVGLIGSLSPATGDGDSSVVRAPDS